MDRIRQTYEILHGSVFRVDATVIPDRIRRPECSFPLYLSNGMNRHKPDHIRTKRPNPVQVLSQRLKCTLFRIVPHKHRIDQLIAQFFSCFSCHTYIIPFCLPDTNFSIVVSITNLFFSSPSLVSCGCLTSIHLLLFHSIADEGCCGML